MLSASEVAVILPELEVWLRQHYGSVASVHIGEAIPLSGGALATSVQRFPVIAQLPHRAVHLDLVWKRPPSWSAEARALQLLQAVNLPNRVPNIIAHGQDSVGSWVVYPYYEGTNPTSDAVPDEVLDTLARIHSHYAVRQEALTDLPVLDMDWWRRLMLDFMIPAFARARSSASRPADLTLLMQTLQRWAQDTRIDEVLAILPRTLIHRDMHTGNIIVGAHNSTIIDWGNAFAGPAYVDLPNIVTRPRASTYFRTRAALMAAPPDPWLDDIGWAWATVQVQGQHIGWALSQGDIDWCLRMAAQGDQALEALGQALARPSHK